MYPLIFLFLYLFFYKEEFETNMAKLIHTHTYTNRVQILSYKLYVLEKVILYLHPSVFQTNKKQIWYNKYNKSICLIYSLWE